MNRSETTLGFRVDDPELEELDRLLSSIAGKLGEIGGMGSSTAPSQRGYQGSAGYQIPVSPANVFTGAGVHSNPGAVGGPAGPINTAGGAPASGGGTAMHVGSLTIHASTVTLIAQQLIMPGVSGGAFGGGGAANQFTGGRQRPMTDEEWAAGLARFQGGGGGQAGGGTGQGGGSDTMLAMLARRLPLAALAYGAVNAAGVGLDYLATGGGASQRWQNVFQNVVGGFPLIGPLGNTLLGPMLRTSVQQDQASEAAAGFGIRQPDFGWGTPQSYVQGTLSAARYGLNPDPEMRSILRGGAVGLEQQQPAMEAFTRGRMSPYLRAAAGRSGSVNRFRLFRQALAEGRTQDAIDMMPMMGGYFDDPGNPLLGIPASGFHGGLSSESMRSMIDWREMASTRMDLDLQLGGSVIGRQQSVVQRESMLGNFAEGGRRQLLIRRQLSEMMSSIDPMLRIAAEDMKSNDPIVQRIGRQTYERLTGEQESLRTQGVQSQFDEASLSTRGRLVGGQRLETIGSTTLSTIQGRGITDPSRIREAFREFSLGLEEQVASLERYVDMLRKIPGVSEDVIKPTLNMIDQLRSRVQTTPMTTVMTVAEAQLGQLGSQGSIAGGAAGLAIIGGGGTAAAYGSTTAQINIFRRQAQIAERGAAEAERIQPGSANADMLRARAMQYRVAEAQAVRGLARVEMPSEFNIRDIETRTHLQRQMMSFTEPGAVFDTRRQLMSLGRERLTALEANRRQRRSEGRWSGGAEEEYVRERESIRMDIFQQRMALDEGWLERLPALMISAPSSAGRIRPSYAMAAESLDRRGLQSRAFGFTSRRGIQAEMERGMHTGGADAFAAFPGDMTLLGMGGTAAATGSGRLKGRPSSKTIPEEDHRFEFAGGSTTPGMTQDQGDQLIRILTMILNEVQSDAPGGQGGPSASGGQGIRQQLIDQGMGLGNRRGAVR